MFIDMPEVFINKRINTLMNVLNQLLINNTQKELINARST